MNTNSSFNNITFAQSSIRFIAAITVILFAMHSSFAGGTVAFVSVVSVAIVYASLAIIGWCPFVALGNKLKVVVSQFSHHDDHFPHGHHA